MYSKTGSLIFLSIACAGGLANAVSLGYGQQLQESDQANHWVIWTEGENACPGMTVLDTNIVDSPCDQPFIVQGVTYKFGACNGGTEPASLLNANGEIIAFCNLDHDKINCHKGLHDIVKHGVCGTA
ncbi:hypothetical protein SAMD00023353_1800130 [Rosellinia necatrix]|uniref:Uncharacterized protein n=1 Tax=Rosellinia necatrix TaxID=77044 RepID=A0A1W2TEE9_ROSNE|nr:hypothetical protein SAMD00023353_1800130 [Rosellinia necatrix]